ncbi:hypothetical protein ACFXGA_06220 [Actinosynnema sp. NPDC059335]|uniref:hypothetical protein n=1 Tax=Actinosynnema sp. NPDC059335 TaxID=3346804 RepID=UPI0036732BE1
MPRRGIAYTAMWAGLLGGGYALVPLLAGPALGTAGLIGTAIGYGALGLGGLWAVRHPRVRYAARVLAGWARSGLSMAWRWAWRQFRRSRLGTVAVKTPWWRPSWTPPRPAPAPPAATPQSGRPAAHQVVTIPARPAGAGRAPALTRRGGVPLPPATALPAAKPGNQPVLSRGSTAGTQVTTTTRKISMSMQHIVEAITNGDSFVPAPREAGKDVEEHLQGYVAVIQALATRFGGDMANIISSLPQFADSLQNLAHFGDALAGFGAEASQQIQQWSDSASHVWR